MANTGDSDEGEFHGALAWNNNDCRHEERARRFLGHADHEVTNEVSSLRDPPTSVDGVLTVCKAKHQRLQLHKFPAWDGANVCQVVGSDDREVAIPESRLRDSP